MSGISEPDGHAYSLEVRKTSEGWEWRALRVVDNTRFENGMGTKPTKKAAIKAGKAHIFAQERKFWDENRAWTKVTI